MMIHHNLPLFTCMFILLYIKKINLGFENMLLYIIKYAFIYHCICFYH